MSRTLVREDTRKLWAFCVHAACPGYEMEEVDGLVREVGDTFKSNGGDHEWIERSQVEYLFADETEEAVKANGPSQAAPCRSCGQRRSLSPEPRPVYDPLSGFDPMGLVKGAAEFDPTVVNTEADAKVAELEAQVARLAALVEKAGKAA